MNSSGAIYQAITDECTKATNGLPSSNPDIALSKGQARNILTALGYTKTLDCVESLLCPDQTELIIPLISDELKRKGRAKDTVKSTLTNTRRLGELARTLYKCANQPSDLPDLSNMPLRQALATVFEAHYPSRSKNHMTREVGVLVANIMLPEHYPTPSFHLKSDCKTLEGRIDFSTGKIRNMLGNATTPTAATKPFLELIERVLLLKPNSLASKTTSEVVPARLDKALKYKLKRTAEEAYVTSLNADEKEEFLWLKEIMAGFNLPAHVESQLEALIIYRTGGKPPARSKATFPSQKRKEISLQHITWTRDGYGISETSETFKNKTKYYMRWLHVEHGVPLADLDLSLLLHDEVMELFVDDCVKRKASSSAHHLIAAVAAMAKPCVGYLSRYHVPVKKFSFTSDQMRELSDSGGLLFFDKQDVWNAHETELYRLLTELSVFAKEEVDNRAGDRGVLWITEHKGGIEAGVEELWKAIDWMVSQSHMMGKHAQKYGPASAAAWLALELRVPLRIKNTTELELLEEPPALHTKPTCPSVWLDEENSYKVFVPKGFLKNGRKKKSASGKDSITDAKATIKDGTRIHSVLSYYLKVRSDALKSRGAISKYLFFLFKTKKDTGKKIQRSVLGARIVRHTEKAFHEVLDGKKLGITFNLNPHGMRHIKAQRILAKEPNNYRKAATALMDSVGTIMSVYGSNNHVLNESELDDDCD